MSNTRVKPQLKRWERRVLLGVLGGVAVLALAGVVGRVNRRSGGLALLREWFDHPLLFGTLMLPLLFAALVLATWPVWLRSVLGVVTVLLGLASVPFWLFSDHRETTRDEAAPGRPDRRLVVVEGSAMIDPLYWVYVDEGTGLARRRWDVAFVNGDWSGLGEVAWDGPDRLRVVVDHRTHLIRIAEGGRPERTLIGADAY
ncbi:hypothetical protein ACFVVX_22280 [Kitasatospora sp. NPDC058170]|uniref:hypothetical protein n=1 Tax=Kitasatospora sp. NPDC058170 TaxID=3346364 RepID=UPI0036D7C2F1